MKKKWPSVNDAFQKKKSKKTSVSKQKRKKRLAQPRNYIALKDYTNEIRGLVCYIKDEFKLTIEMRDIILNNLNNKQQNAELLRMMFSSFVYY